MAPATRTERDTPADYPPALDEILGEFGLGLCVEPHLIEGEDGIPQSAGEIYWIGTVSDDPTVGLYHWNTGIEFQSVHELNRWIESPEAVEDVRAAILTELGPDDLEAFDAKARHQLEPIGAILPRVMAGIRAKVREPRGRWEWVGWRARFIRHFIGGMVFGCGAIVGIVALIVVVVLLAGCAKQPPETEARCIPQEDGSEVCWTPVEEPIIWTEEER